MAEASIGLTTVTDDGSMHIRAWNVPPEVAEAFAVRMTFWYGEPDEMVSDLEAMDARGRQAAAEGDALFLMRGAEGGRDA